MIPTFAGTINESVLSPPSHEPEIALGRVGWPGDDDIVDLGTADNDGATLLKVTLHRGGYPGDIPKPGEAAGYRVRVRVMGPVFDVPPKGTEVCVAFPGGIGMVAGAGVLLGSLTRTPDHQFSATATKIDAGTERDLILKGRAVTMTMHSPTGSGPEPYVSLTPEDGIQALDADGFGFLVKDQAVTIFAPDEDGDAKSIVRLTKSQIMIANRDANGAPCSVTLGDQEVCLAGLASNSFTPGANLGAAATAATPAVVGVGTAAAVAAWVAALTVWATAVTSAVNALAPGSIAVPLPPMPMAPSATINIQP